MRAPQTILIVLLLVGGVIPTSLASPYAVEVIRANGPFGATPYNDPNAVLGAPATQFSDPFGAFSGGTTNRRVKLVEAAFNLAANTNGLLTPKLLLTLSGGSEVIARFDHPVYDHPAHPYGIDLLVFGNSFYTPNAFVNDSTDMSACLLSGTIFSEPLKVSVSPGFTSQPGEVANDPDTWPWYRYDNGPFADSSFPTQAYKWNHATTNWSDEQMDFTKPVNPALQSVFSAGGLPAADGIDLYDSSGGGTGFDLAESGFSWIQYVKVEGIDPAFSDGEVDAFAIVRPMLVGDSLSITPENISSNTATLFFQKPGVEGETVASLTFTSLSGIAQVSTAPLTNWSAFAPLPGPALHAVQLNLAPLLGSTPVTFATDLALAVGTNYSGTGSDLLAFQSTGTNWTALPFSYHATNHQVHVVGVTNLSAFVVAPFTAPTLQLAVTGASRNISFTSVATLTHTLERSTDLTHWSALSSFTPSNVSSVVLTDNTAPTGQAFYRVKVNRP